MAEKSAKVETVGEGDEKTIVITVPLEGLDSIEAEELTNNLRLLASHRLNVHRVKQKEKG